MGLRSDPETPIVQRSVVQSQPQTQTGLAWSRIQKGRILVGMNRPTDHGILKNVHGLGHHWILVSQRQDQFPQFSRGCVIKEGFVNVVDAIVVVVVFLLVFAPVAAFLGFRRSNGPSNSTKRWRQMQSVSGLAQGVHLFVVAAAVRLVLAVVILVAVVPEFWFQSPRFGIKCSGFCEIRHLVGTFQKGIPPCCVGFDIGRKGRRCFFVFLVSIAFVFFRC
mmetsp:Transcript_25764/g.56526  ORF Transcript_25764/g.56526 Transcript_25764/m.56526 type:complete len:220 (-) Transcript_25764:134-793(-)